MPQLNPTTSATQLAAVAVAATTPWRSITPHAPAMAIFSICSVSLPLSVHPTDAANPFRSISSQLPVPEMRIRVWEYENLRESAKA